MRRTPFRNPFQPASEPEAGVSARSAPSRPSDRARNPETYIHWDRGLAIVAGIIGIVSLFVLLITFLPIREADDERALTGLGPAGETAVPATATPRAAATAAPPPTGPDQPRLAATARQFPFVRRGPGINYAVITNLQQGQRVEVVGRSPDRAWYQVVLPDNARERGWVSQDLLEVTGDINTVPEVRE